MCGAWTLQLLQLSRSCGTKYNAGHCLAAWPLCPKSFACGIRNCCALVAARQARGTQVELLQKEHSPALKAALLELDEPLADIEDPAGVAAACTQLLGAARERHGEAQIAADSARQQLLSAQASLRGQEEIVSKVALGCDHLPAQHPTVALLAAPASCVGRCCCTARQCTCSSGTQGIGCYTN